MNLRAKHFGSSIWITDGSDNRRIQNTCPIPENWRRGRTYEQCRFAEHKIEQKVLLLFLYALGGRKSIKGRPAWNKGKTNVELYGPEKRAKARLSKQQAMLALWRDPEYREKVSLAHKKEMPPKQEFEQNSYLRTCSDYNKWRFKVFERDKFTCKRCGKCEGQYLNAHHVKPWKQFPESRFMLSNGKTVCADPCHRDEHKEMSFIHLLLKILSCTI